MSGESAPETNDYDRNDPFIDDSQNNECVFEATINHKLHADREQEATNHKNHARKLIETNIEQFNFVLMDKEEFFTMLNINK